jgi:hypothetical protein
MATDIRPIPNNPSDETADGPAFSRGRSGRSRPFGVSVKRPGSASVRIWRPLRVSHGWDNTVKCSFDELAGCGVELVIAIFQAV